MSLNHKNNCGKYSKFMKNVGASIDPKADIEKQYPGLWETIPEKYPTEPLPESKKCYICSGKALPDESRTGFWGELGNEITNRIQEGLKWLFG